MSTERFLVLATANPGKLREMQEVLGDLPLRVVCLGDLDEIEPPIEDGATFAENAGIKALGYARATGHWCLADDSGLVVDALGGAPGVRSARYAANDVPTGAERSEIDAANTAHLLRELHGVPTRDRRARFVCHLALADSRRILLEISGAVEGLITDSPRGRNGFGYDPVFFLPRLGRTAAELSADEKNAISHRGRAVRRFAEILMGRPDLLAGLREPRGDDPAA